MDYTQKVRLTDDPHEVDLRVLEMFELLKVNRSLSFGFHELKAKSTQELLNMARSRNGFERGGFGHPHPAVGWLATPKPAGWG